MDRSRASDVAKENADGGRSGSPTSSRSVERKCHSFGLQAGSSLPGDLSIAGCEGGHAGNSAECADDLQPSDISEEEMDDSEAEDAPNEVAEESRNLVNNVEEHKHCVQETGRKKYASEDHNRKERIRRRELKEAVFKLRNQLRNRTKKPSTISVLKAAQQEILDLTSLEKRDRGRLEELNQKHIHLQLRLERLMSDIKRGEQGPQSHLLSKLTSIPASSTAAPYPLPMASTVSRGHAPPLQGVPPPTMLLVRHGHPSLMVPPAPPLPRSLLAGMQANFVAPPPPVPSAHHHHHHPPPSLATPFPPGHPHHPHTLPPPPTAHHPHSTQPCFPALGAGLRRPGAGGPNTVGLAPSDGGAGHPLGLTASPPALHRVVPRPYIFSHAPPNMPISFPMSATPPIGIAGLVGTATLPQLPLIGGTLPNQQTTGGVGGGGGGVAFPCLPSSWTSNPLADQRPVFPVTLFANHHHHLRPPSSPVTMTTTTGRSASPIASSTKPPCPPLLSSDSVETHEEAPTPPSTPPSSPPPLRPASSVVPHTTATPDCRPCPQHHEAMPTSSSPSCHHGNEEATPRISSQEGISLTRLSRKRRRRRRRRGERSFSSYSDDSRISPNPPQLHSIATPPREAAELEAHSIARIVQPSCTASLNSSRGSNHGTDETFRTCETAPESRHHSKIPIETKRKASKGEDVTLADCEALNYDYGREKRMRGRECRSSSSDSDSGGSCSSGQGGRSQRSTRNRHVTRRSTRAMTSHGSGSGGGSNSKGSNKRTTSTNSSGVIVVPDEEEEPSPEKVGVATGGRGIVMSLTSNCHISNGSDIRALGLGGQQRYRNGDRKASMYLLPPALWREESDKTEKALLNGITSSHSGSNASCISTDEIVKKSMDNLSRKFGLNSSGFSDGGNSPSITQNSPMYLHSQA